MGTHAKPRTRVRSIALGTLAVGATLTGVGLTAAALDPAGVSLADGTRGGDPVDLSASGLGAPVPVADVSSLGGAAIPGSGLSTGTLSLGTVPTLGTGAVTHGLLPGSATAVRPTTAVQEPTWPHGANVGKVPGHERPQGTATTPSPSTGSAPSSSDGNSGASSDLLATGPLSLDQVAPGLPGKLSTGIGKAKSTVGGLLTEVAGLL